MAFTIKHMPIFQPVSSYVVVNALLIQLPVIAWTALWYGYGFGIMDYKNTCHAAGYVLHRKVLGVAKGTV